MAFSSRDEPTGLAENEYRRPRSRRPSTPATRSPPHQNAAAMGSISHQDAGGWRTETGGDVARNDIGNGLIVMDLSEIKR